MHTYPLELWGGVECTVNRVGDRYFDQLERNGHAWREGDLERFAGLGLKALRYPVLWERMAPETALVTDWSWTDYRLGRLRELGIRPIVGLIHHGSGPRRTNLLDPGFAEGLADFARQVAERYPWIEDYTPVNEPLTTARFSALYGHWYPHAHDDHSFIRAFLNQCKGVALSMRAVRAVNPAARLVQTEDLGKTFSTPALAAQAEFENQRRWLTFDLLCGRIDEAHPMSGYLREFGAPDHELDWFRAHPCPPDLLGINHYVTSERFLDERLERYPAYSYSGNEHLAYADMPAVRASEQGLSGAGRLLREAWERYELPLAITEAQLNCTREEQMRWVTEIWRDAQSLRVREGADIRAVTLWALLGSYNWTNLLTRDDPASYEPGAFDLRGTEPRPTALAALARTLARDGDTNHPVLDVPGWWRRAERFACSPAQAHQPLAPSVGRKAKEDPRPILVVGQGSALAHAFGVACHDRALPVRLVGPDDLDVSDPAAWRRVLAEVRPWAVIHTNDPAATDQEQPHPFAVVCAEQGLPTISFVSRQADAPHAPPAPAGAALVVCSDILFGPWDDADRVLRALRAVVDSGSDELPCDRSFSLTYLPDLAHACLELLLDEEKGVWHLANAGVLDREMFLASAREFTGTGKPANGSRGPAPKHSPAMPPQTDGEPIGRQTRYLPCWQSALKHLVDTRMPVRRAAA